MIVFPRIFPEQGQRPLSLRGFSCLSVCCPMQQMYTNVASNWLELWCFQDYVGSCQSCLLNSWRFLMASLAGAHWIILLCKNCPWRSRIPRTPLCLWLFPDGESLLEASSQEKTFRLNLPHWPLPSVVPMLPKQFSSFSFPSPFPDRTVGHPTHPTPRASFQTLARFSLQLRKHKSTKSLKPSYCQPSPGRATMGSMWAIGRAGGAGGAGGASHWGPDALMPSPVWLMKRTFGQRSVNKLGERRLQVSHRCHWNPRAQFFWDGPHASLATSRPPLHIADMSGYHLAWQIKNNLYMSCLSQTFRWSRGSVPVHNLSTLLAAMCLGAAIKVGKSSCSCCAPHHSCACLASMCAQLFLAIFMSILRNKRML